MMGGIVCPPNSYVYVTSTGGNSNYASGGTAYDNHALALMSGIGTCSSITPQTFIQVNEVTTAATVVALQQFMTATFATAYAENVGAPMALTSR